MQFHDQLNHDFNLERAALPSTSDPELKSFRELSGRIGILGGSFDPPHVGHLEVAKATVRALNLDSLVFIPTSQNPLKAQSGATAEHRIKMVKAMLQGEPGLYVSPIEIASSGPSYTVETLKRIHAELNPGSELFFVIGNDAANELSRWRDVELIPQLATVVTVPRAGDCKISNSPIPLLQLIDSELPNIDVSSTEIRSRLHSHEAPDLIPQAVMEYIERHGLYK